MINPEDKTRIRYNVINSKTGNEEHWTGIFQSKSLSDEWYNKWGKYWESKGKQLIERVVYDDLE
jgi:hypothetical protein